MEIFVSTLSTPQRRPLPFLPLEDGVNVHLHAVVSATHQGVRHRTKGGCCIKSTRGESTDLSLDAENDYNESSTPNQCTFTSSLNHDSLASLKVSSCGSLYDINPSWSLLLMFPSVMRPGLWHKARQLHSNGMRQIGSPSRPRNPFSFGTPDNVLAKFVHTHSLTHSLTNVRDRLPLSRCRGTYGWLGLYRSFPASREGVCIRMCCSARTPRWPNLVPSFSDVVGHAKNLRASHAKGAEDQV